VTSQVRADPAGGAVRLLRAGSCTVAAVTLALVAHSVAGGERPAALALLAGTVVLGCAAMLATGRRLGRVATASGLVLTQLGLHTWFSLAGGHGCDVGGLVLTHHHAQVVDCAAAGHGGGQLAAAAPGPGPWWWAMPVAHLLAVLLTALLLAHGEALLWRLADLAGGRLLRLVRVDPVVDRTRVVTLVWTAPAASTAFLLDPLRGRAPPVPVRAR
jgi:hypothetical protein